MPKMVYVHHMDELEKSSAATLSRNLSTVHALWGAFGPAHVTLLNCVFTHKGLNLQLFVSVSMPGTMVPSLRCRGLQAQASLYTACVKSWYFHGLV